MSELQLDFPGLEIGIAEYDDGPTGCTVFHFPDGPFPIVHDVRGGSAVVVGTTVGVADAICLAGGSAYGIAAITGVQAELLERRGFSTAWDDIAVVHGAIIYDFRRRTNAIHPDKELGRRALQAAKRGVFPSGPRGAGRSATVGKTFGYDGAEPAGQGGAFAAIGETRVAVFTVVNAYGAVFDRNGEVVRGHLDPETGTRLRIVDGLERHAAPAGGNTTLTVLVTNQILEPRAHRQLAAQVHASMARPIQPFHALVDGDVLFAVTTAKVDNPSVDPIMLGVVASELAWDAVLAAVAT